MSRLTRRLILVCALVGLGASLTSLYVHSQLLINPSYRNFCDVSATVRCTDAYLSRYGSLLGVPVALFGVTFFASIVGLCAMAVAWPSILEKSHASYIFVFSTIGFGVIVYLAYAAFFVLKAVCHLCVTTYVAVIALFILSGITASIPMSTSPAACLQTSVPSRRGLWRCSSLRSSPSHLSRRLPSFRRAEEQYRPPPDCPASLFEGPDNTRPRRDGGAAMRRTLHAHRAIRECVRRS